MSHNFNLKLKAKLGYFQIGVCPCNKGSYHYGLIRNFEDEKEIVQERDYREETTCFVAEYAHERERVEICVAFERNWNEHSYGVSLSQNTGALQRHIHGLLILINYNYYYYYYY